MYDFVKRSSLIQVSAAGAQVLGPVAAELAYGEGLQAHARAAEMRLQGQGAGPAPAPQAKPFSVRPVTADNLDAVLKLAVAPGQRRFVATVERSLAQVAYEPAGWPLVIYSGEDPAGFMLLYDARKDQEDPAEQLYIWRLMVDARYQRLGLGRRAIDWVVEEARRMGLPVVGLSHVMAAGHAGPFYEKLGFAYNGKIDAGEHEMVLRVLD